MGSTRASENDPGRGRCRSLSPTRHCLLWRFFRSSRSRRCLRFSSFVCATQDLVPEGAGCNGAVLRALIDGGALGDLGFCLRADPPSEELLESPLPGTEEGGEGATPLVYAAARGRAKMVGLLLEAGADPRATLNVSIYKKNLYSFLPAAKPSGPRAVEVVLVVVGRGQV